MDAITKTNKLHAVILLSPGMGHLIPVIELGKRLAHNGFYVSVLAVCASSKPPAAETRIIEDAMSLKLFDIVKVTAMDISGLVDPDATVVTSLRVMMREAQPALRVRAALSALTVRPDVLILDLFSTKHMVLGNELRIPKFVYIASNAWFLALGLYSPTLDKLMDGQHVDQTMPFDIPGCKPVRPEDVVYPMLDRFNQQHHEYIRIATEWPMGDGILLNIWEEFQPETLAALRDERLLGRIARVPIYPIGPLIRSLDPDDPNTTVFAWLDRQPSESVIFVSFGSGGTLSADQLTEVAWGLELSRVRFIWVIRAPTLKSGPGSFFDSGNGSMDTSSYLPEGFIERTRETGLLVQHWAMQTSVLAHPSTGGFLTHCGWNSILESIMNGVPMIAWPLYAEQAMNATLLVEDLEVAARPKVLPSKKTVERDQIQRLVRKIMADEAGDAMRKKAKELKRCGQEALSQDGSSYECLCKLKEELSPGQVGRRY